MRRSRARGFSSALRRRLAGERGFTLVELLVVFMIIGLLAALAYAVFLGQRTKAHDAKSKDQAAAVAVDVEACFTDADSYAQCRTVTQLGDKSIGIDTSVAARPNCNQDPSISGDVYADPAQGKVAVVASNGNCYLIESVSDDGHYFWVLKRNLQPATRTCAPPGQGGCVDTGDPATGSWSSK